MLCNSEVRFSTARLSATPAAAAETAGKMPLAIFIAVIRRFEGLPWVLFLFSFCFCLCFLVCFAAPATVGSLAVFFRFSWHVISHHFWPLLVLAFVWHFVFMYFMQRQVKHKFC